MRIAIIGAGIAGVSSAYELAADGHQVVVFERRGSVAAEGSFANAGLVAPGLALPWPAPRMPGLLGLGSRRFGWQWRRWRSGRKPDLAAREQLLRLAQFSHQRLQTLRRHMQLDYERAEGALVLMRQARESAAIAPGLALLDAAGLGHRRLDAEQCRAAEPGLNPDMPLLGGVSLGLAEVGNCRQFAHQLRLQAQRLGVQFRFHTTVRSLGAGAPVRLLHEYTPPQDNAGPASRLPHADEAGDTEPAVHGPQQDSFDAVVVCAAFESAALLRPLGLKLPLIEVHSHSITAPLRQLEAHPDLGPRAALYELERDVVISRIGQRVRVSSGLQIGRAPEQYRDAALEPLHRALHDWFPGAIQNGQVQRWKGSHAVLADDLPLLGASGQTGIWLNIAQGAPGWPIACGAARVLAERIAGLTPELDTGRLDLSRLG